MLYPLITAALLATTVSAHTWLEQMQLIAPNGSYVGDPGYARGYVARTDPTFNGYVDKWQLPSPEIDLGRTRINSSDFLCHPAQRVSNYTAEYPQLKVAPGTYVALRYLENGHVTQPWIPAGKPAGSGTAFVYGTYSPSATEKIVDVLQWTTDGKGGNGNGFLMTAQNFDDDRCHQPNSAPISIERQMEFPDVVPGQEAWCETDLNIPQNSKTGSTLTIYWVWSWQTADETEGVVCGKDEYYTTCADFEVVDNTADDLYRAAKVHTLVQQDPQKTAVSDFKSRTAFMTTPNLVTTEGCNFTTYTTSSLPATLTKMTTLPAEFWVTYTDSSSSPAATLASSTSTPTVSTTSTPSSTSVSMVTTTVISIQTVFVTPTLSATANGIVGEDQNGFAELPRRRANGFVA